MVDNNIYKSNVEYNKKVEQISELPPLNPLHLRAGLTEHISSYNYSQELLIPKFDREIVVVRNKIAEMELITPKSLRLPYSVKIDEINGERILKTDGSLQLIREYENDIIREYYPASDSIYISKIIEIDKNSLNVISKTEPFVMPDGNYKANVIIFDENINHKYTMFHIEENGAISSTTEIFADGKSFRTLFRNLQTLKPQRYVESWENVYGKSELLDCKLSPDVHEIKYITLEKDVVIKYENDKKIIDVRRKIPEI